MPIRSVSDLVLNYQSSGRGKPLVLLHPIGVDSHFWDPVSQQLAERYSLLAIDLPGHGASEAPKGDFTLKSVADIVATLIAGLCDDKVVLVGCSMGGMIAQELAIARPDLVRAMVLSNSAHTLSDAARTGIVERAREALKGMSAVADTTIDRWFSPAFRSAHPDVVEAVRQHLAKIDPSVHARSWMAIAQLDTAPRLASVDVPTLVATGELDVSTPPEVAAAIAKSIPNSILKIAADAGHLLPIEQPVLFACWIDKFVQSLPVGIEDRKPFSR